MFYLRISKIMEAPKPPHLEHLKICKRSVNSERHAMIYCSTQNLRRMAPLTMTFEVQGYINLNL